MGSGKKKGNREGMLSRLQGICPIKMGVVRRPAAISPGTSRRSCNGVGHDMYTVMNFVQSQPISGGEPPKSDAVVDPETG